MKKYNFSCYPEHWIPVKKHWQSERGGVREICERTEEFVPAALAEEMLDMLKRTSEELQFCRDEKQYPSKDLIKEIQSIIAKAEETA